MAAERVWLFDLDNTLHNAAASAFGPLDTAMNAYIERELGVSAAEANRLRAHYWHRYGATLLGLMRHHGVKPAHFLHDTHVLPELEQDLAAHPRDLAAFRRLKGRKYILTNAPLAYAERVLRALGLLRHVDGVIGIEQMTMFGHWRPKPDARMFRALTVRLGVPPGRCVLVEDTLAHQKSARGVGMRTVWMQRWAKRGAHGPEVGVYLHRRPAYVCARISSLQQLHRVP
ncbi:MAG: HAD-IA family hydrolase [Burkholderiaceae bacterium]